MKKWFYLTLIRRVIGINLKHLGFSSEHFLLYIVGNV